MKPLKLVLKAWPVVFLATVAVSYLTQGVAKLFGIDLPEQSQVELMRRYAGWNLTFAWLVAQVVVLIPAVEEVLFRLCLFKLPSRLCGRLSVAAAVCSSALFSFAHYVDYVRLSASRTFALTGWNNAFIALFFFGLAQCWLYRRSGWLWTAIANHALFNMTNLVLLLVIREPGAAQAAAF